ncbi:uncharacterized protein CTHT_0072430 [Thermochaetoides thermophila DSM 1495]|uniref:Oxo-4-hydroxy-4-carboxy-5-ureidoimidazoline decarboxylase domain-containing protein n=1 Tax=Chaetomium thermophilum (strain DSM 1495 / CBS 144.50 / IMI 039719) TaxID=759272 RepID=G0SFX0_CHATD|nr:hypothetical protein CTHT_0072430 [Thermochaetoides thermophila DSM 1495]EGS17885.1 hypothetical protein CTHT_0072430 [Thermochaetoides thermophila DSM 1495]
MSLPEISSLSPLPDDQLLSTLDLLFEPSPSLHSLALPILRSSQFSSYAELITSVGEQLRSLSSKAFPSQDRSINPGVPTGGDEESKKQLLDILGSHPRLGEKKLTALSGLSKEEQGHLRGEIERLMEMNRVYEERFPGLRYVVWVNGRSTTEIEENAGRRVNRGNYTAEVEEIIQAMCDIAKDRARKLGAN